MRLKLSLLLLFVLLLPACDSSADRVLSIDAEGRVLGFAFLDRDANGVFDPAVDRPASGVNVTLLPPGGTTALAQATSDANGQYIFSAIPVGRYRLHVDSASVADSVRVAGVDSAFFTVALADTPRVSVMLTYPRVSVTDVATLPGGMRVLLRGVALNGYTAFGDSTLHIADSTGVLRVVRVIPTPVIAGDTVRLVGTVTPHDGKQTLADATAFRVAPGALLRTPVPLTTAAAATANGGALDADLVRITNATIINTQLSGNGRLTLTVDDGSGTLQVIIEPTSAFNNRPTIVTGAVLDVTGLLVPNSTRTAWHLKPRSTADLTVNYRRVTIAQARLEPVGRLVEIDGLAVNGWHTYGDATVHLHDATGWLRTISVRAANIFAGDSVRFLGIIAMRDGQPVLAQVEPTVLATGRTLPAPQVLTTANASTANGGVLDAALVRIDNATIETAATIGTGDFQLQVDDGSGLLTVIIDRDLGLQTTPYVVDAKVSVTGVLVPAIGGGTWTLRPRSQTDIVVTP